MLQANSTALVKMGFTVGAMRHGVYQLRRYEGPYNEMTFDGVGLFLSRKQPAGAGDVLFYEFNGLAVRREPGAMNRLLETWGDLDARCLDESGIRGTVVDAADLLGAVKDDNLTLPRPTADRLRHVAIMESGDVVCYD